MIILDKTINNDDKVIKGFKSNLKNIKDVLINGKTKPKDSNNKGILIRKLENHNKNVDVLRLIEKTNNKTMVSRTEKKPKDFKEILKENFDKNSLSIKQTRININTQKTVSTKDKSTNYLNNTSFKNKISFFNTKLYVKSQNFKPSQFKNKGSTGKVLIQYPNCFNKHTNSLETGKVICSTKSNSFASSYSNSNTLSNSLKQINLKYQISSSNTESSVSNNSFSNSKEPKFGYGNLDKIKNSTTCNVEISLNTNKFKKAVLSSSEHKEKKKIIDKRIKTINKMQKKK